MFDGVRVLPVRGLPEVRAGDDLAELLVTAAAQQPVGGLASGDVVVVTHKAVAKAEGCTIDLRSIDPSPFALEFARRWDKDARQVEVVLRQSARIVRMDHGVIICETRHGFICANAGIDRSNAGAPDTVVTLPDDPDDSARAIHDRITDRLGVDVAVVVSDTFGRTWREGLTNVAIGCAGLQPLRDERGRVDPAGYRLEATALAVADELASAAELAMGKLDGVPAAIIRGYAYEHGDGAVRAMLRPPERDLFR